MSGSKLLLSVRRCCSKSRRALEVSLGGGWDKLFETGAYLIPYWFCYSRNYLAQGLLLGYLAQEVRITFLGSIMRSGI